MSFRRDKNVERDLRANRPAPSDEFVRDLAARAQAAPAGRVGFRLAFAGVLTAALLVALAAVGGLGYAASSVTEVVKVAKRIVAPTRSAQPIEVSAGGDQYRPGYGFGDPNHNHSGPPGLTKKQTKPRVVHAWPTAFVNTSFTIDEQAHLIINVVDTKGKQLLLTQSKSKIGGDSLSGPPTKAIRFLVLVPRTLGMTLAIPRSQMVMGHEYVIVITATDPDGNVKKLKIPFTA
jgi:hypothetical protein